MKKNSQRGFSMVELMIVCVVIGIVAVLAVPYLQKALHAAENGNTFATLRTVSSTQLGYFHTNARFGRLTEINNLMANALGTPSGNELHRGRFVLAMVPAVPTDPELRTGYTITATRNVTGEGVVYVYELTQSGEVRQILP
jgi:prepilin-type N-terminal cleavage/methylation domain-containing protein